MKRKDITLTKEEVVKVVERAIELLNLDIRYICHALADGIEYVKDIDDVLSNPETFGHEESNQSGETYSKHSLQELNELLDQAVSHEDYEKAAKIRDEISKR